MQNKKLRILFSTIILIINVTLVSYGQQLGSDNKKLAEKGFVQIANGVDHIFAGGAASYLLKNNGDLYIAGVFDVEKIGEIKISTFTKVLSAVKFVNSINYFGRFFVIKNDNSAWLCQPEFVNSKVTIKSKKIADNTSYVFTYKILEDSTPKIYVIDLQSRLWEFSESSLLFDEDRSNPKLIAQDVQKMSDTLVLKKDSTVWDYFSENIKVSISEIKPKQVAQDVKDIFSHGATSFIINSDNTLWASGDNQFGLFGNGSTSNSKEFVKVTQDVKQIIATEMETRVIILKYDGTVWMTGINSPHLSNYLPEFGTRFKQLFSDAQEIAVGEHHLLVLKRDGTVWAIGSNNGSDGL